LHCVLRQDAMLHARTVHEPLIRRHHIYRYMTVFMLRCGLIATTLVRTGILGNRLGTGLLPRGRPAGVRLLLRPVTLLLGLHFSRDVSFPSRNFSLHVDFIVLAIRTHRERYCYSA
jgi:hypothetical protein